MQVSDIHESLVLKEYSPVVTLAEVRLTEEGLTIPNVNEPIQFDHPAQKALGRHLGINPTYLGKCPTELQRTNVNYWLGHYAETQAVFHIYDDTLVAVHDPDKKVFTIKSILDIITRNFEPTDHVLEVRRSMDRLVIDILSNEREVYDDNLRDNVCAGVRISAWPTTDKAPRVETILTMADTSETLTIESAFSEPDTRGKTMEEAIEEVDRAVEMALATSTQHIASLLDSYSHEIPDIYALMPNLATEYGLSKKVKETFVVRTEDDMLGNTVHDLIMVCTTLAQETSFRSEVKLQRLAGDLVVKHEHVFTHRCPKCAKHED